ncbi:unnamed protein product [Psylliodes chrysocephalus]|uniref:Uncharacterized protein n=1 Tax=Psylliodes chrysocephalus TaxID=3402493 RepID=A0A9P0GKT9_9CUCU|nr:unnamed protein product [Psylliodes chrysocephala]
MSSFSNFNVVTLENGNILTSENGEICLQSISDGSLCFVKPTQEIINAFNTQSCDEAVGQTDDNLETSTELSCSSFDSYVKNENKRIKWSKSAILMLIDLRIKYDEEFKSTINKNEITWKRIAQELKQNVKDNRGDKGTGEEALDFPYYEEMDNFLAKKHNVKPIAIAASLRGDTMSNEHNAEVLEAAQSSKEKGSKVKSKMGNIQPKKTGLLTIWDEMKMTNKEREINRDRRHQEILAVRNRAVDVFSDKMNLLLEKFKK